MDLNIEFIRKLLTEKGWSVRKLALKSGLSSATICRILNHKRRAGRRAIAGIMKAFPEESIEELFFLP